MALIFTLVLAGPAAASVTLGLTAPQGAEAAIERWQKLFDAVSEEVGVEVNLFPLGPQEGAEAFFAGHIDFLLANPVQSALIADTMDAIPVASMVHPHGDQFAGVIVVRQDSDIQSLEDLRGRSFAALGDWAAGGYLFQAAHIMSSGLPRPDAFATRQRASNQNALVQMVQSQTVDAAFIRTGIIENLIRSGKLAEGELRVLDAQAMDEADMLRTTRWYPEWFMMASSTLPPELVEQFGAALMAIEADSGPARAARISGFQQPLDVTPVVDAMRQVGVPPYD